MKKPPTFDKLIHHRRTRWAGTACLVVFSALVHIAGLIFALFAPGRIVVYIAPSFFLVALAFGIALGSFGKPNDAASSMVAVPTSSSSPSSPSLSSSDLPNITTRSVSPSSSPGRAEAGSPLRRRVGTSPTTADAPIVAESQESLTNGLEGLNVESTEELLAVVPPSKLASSSSPMVAPKSIAVVPLQQPAWPWTRILAWVNLVVQVAWLLLIAYIAFAPWLFLHAEIEDVVYARLGHVGPTDARIVFRVPPTPFAPLTTPSSALQVSVRRAGTSAWDIVGDGAAVSAEHDWTGMVVATGLQPRTTYEYRVTSPLPSSTSATAAVAEAAAALLSGTFTTAPTPTDPAATLKLVFGSCVKRDTPFLSERGIRGFRTIASAPVVARAELMLFLGDFIYADVPFVYGSGLDAFRWHYKYTLAAPESVAAVKKMPSYFIYDDHEFSNNWDAGESGVYWNAARAYTEYLGRGNPLSIDPLDTAAHPNAPQYYSFTRAPACFFVFDLRRYRTASYSNGTAPLLGEQQWTAFSTWLNSTLAPDSGCTWRILGSSVPVTTNWDIDGDTWAGYTAERTRLLDLVHSSGAKNTVVLSGDRHAVGVQRLVPHREVVEYSVSPIGAFVPPISFYRSKGGDEELYEKVAGNSKMGMIDMDRTKLRFNLVIGEDVVWEHELTAE
ncbi:PhoD-like phosphatase-domain-containing protein [Blastocladiella britannica]|nr:PhoD-like phosphatase-domain-containing protein [Blastocladiella britannica]